MADMQSDIGMIGDSYSAMSWGRKRRGSPPFWCANLIPKRPTFAPIWRRLSQVIEQY
jgi:hypothetical protein